ncbi:hypothetical protein FF36_05165 [Frankia torreyi]|uniref:Uncharacterized protein n=1 Tax=Frankia torreyi TaxID=1856 RepID=A0A0D8B8G0_9ACTN|nr:MULTISPECIES: hypothetical protein [Frankia]KJE20573.1 hypothetical protein FF36_05165 [Frankia torreyi]KQM02862.1 hypothetical protein FF86_10532 [Frankia sp. CpI1-P]
MQTAPRLVTVSGPRVPHRSQPGISGTRAVGFFLAAVVFFDRGALVDRRH